MGQYLMIGLKLGLSIDKDNIRECMTEGRTEEDILKQMEKSLCLDKFKRVEDDKRYEYSIDSRILDKELVPFLKRFYELRYIDKYKYGSDVVVSKLESLSTLEERLEILDKNPCESFRKGKKYRIFYVDDFCIKRVIYISKELILSMDGKIIMECYSGVLDFFRRCIASHFEGFELASLIDVYISD